MKNFLLPALVAIIGFNANVNAQCTPTNCLSSLPAYGGICDTALIDGIVLQSYSDFESFHYTTACFDAGVYEPSNAGTTIKINSTHDYTYVGLPAGIVATTNQATYNSPSNGCVSFSGTPTQIGVFNPTINFLADITVNTSSCFAILTQNNNAFAYSMHLEIKPDASFTIPSTSFTTVSSPVTLTSTGTTGGAFSGPGVSGNTFDPAMAGPGTHTIQYLVSKQEGAAVAPSSASTSIQVTVAAIPDLVISEIMYNGPESGTDTTEFIEIYNNDANPVDLTNYSFSQGVTYTFPNVTLNPGEFYVVAVNAVAFNNVFGFMPDGVFTGGLSNAGEDITIIDASGNMVDSVNYDDAAPWPFGFAAGEPDGGGSSVVLCDVNADNNDGNNWNASVMGTGVMINGFEVKASPGTANFCCSMDVTPPAITCADTDTLFAGSGACGVSSSFVNVYYIPLSQISSEGINGPDCNSTGSDAWSCDSVGLSLSWTSLETNTPLSVDVELYQSYYGVGGISSTTFNGSPNNDYSSADGMCSNQLINYSLNPSGYNVGGSNTLTLIPTTDCIVLDENPDLSWDPQSYAKVTVVYGTGSVLTEPTVTDNCTVDTVYNDAPAILPVGLTNVTWTAKDANGNSNTCTQQVVVLDTIAPMIDCPGDVTLAADSGACGLPSSFSVVKEYYIPLSQITSGGVGGPDCNGTGNDAYSCGEDMTLTWTSLETLNPSSVQIEFYQSYYDEGANSPTTFNGSPNNDYVSSNYSCSNQVINYTLNPTGYNVGGINTLIISPSTDCIVLDENPDISWAPQSYAKVIVTTSIGVASATDNCAVDTVYNDAPANLPVGTTTVTWTAVDVNGNSSTCTQQVTIEDQEAPMAVCQNINAYLDGSGIVVITDADLDGGSTDNCIGALTYSAQYTTFTCNELGAKNDTLTVIDAAGNTSTCVAVVTVLDTVSPTIMCPSDMFVCSGDVVTYSIPTGADNCSQAVTQTDVTGLTSGMVFPAGVTTIEYTSTDSSGNTAVCSFNVTVSTIDNTIDNSMMPTLTANQAGASYRWLDCDNGNAVIPSETGQSYTATMNGNYAVEITMGSCVDTSACESVTGVGVREMNNQVVSIYPNPTNGIITVDLGVNNSLVNYTVVTIEGRILVQGRTVDNKVIIDLSGESKGVYFLQLKDENSSNVYKVLKQ